MRANRPMVCLCVCDCGVCVCMCHRLRRLVSGSGGSEMKGGKMEGTKRAGRGRNAMWNTLALDGSNSHSLFGREGNSAAVLNPAKTTRLSFTSSPPALPPVLSLSRPYPALLSSTLLKEFFLSLSLSTRTLCAHATRVQ